MKKYYDYYVNRRNTPHLDLYTKLIGMFYFWNGMNFILGSAYALSIGQKKLAVSGLVLGILMCSLIKDKTTDKRKNQRDLKAVIGDGIIYAICALGISYVVVILVIAPCVYFRNDLCSLGYLQIFQTAKWTKIQKAEKKRLSG